MRTRHHANDVSFADDLMLLALRRSFAKRPTTGHCRRKPSDKAMPWSPTCPEKKKTKCSVCRACTASTSDMIVLVVQDAAQRQTRAISARAPGPGGEATNRAGGTLIAARRARTNYAIARHSLPSTPHSLRHFENGTIGPAGVNPVDRSGVECDAARVILTRSYRLASPTRLGHPGKLVTKDLGPVNVR